MHFIWVSMYLQDPAILRGHRSHAKVQPLCKLKGVPSFLSYFKTLSISPVPGIETVTPAPQSSALPTELILLRLKT